MCGKEDCTCNGNCGENCKCKETNKKIFSIEKDENRWRIKCPEINIDFHLDSENDVNDFVSKVENELKPKIKNGKEQKPSIHRKIRFIRDLMIDKISNGVREIVVDEVKYQDEVCMDFCKTLSETEIKELLQCKTPISVANRTHRFKVAS